MNLNTLKTLFDSFYEAIYIVDKNRKIVYFNPKAEEITGFSKEEIIGKHCHENTLNHVDDTGKQLCLSGCPLLYAIKNDETIDADVYLHHKKGHRIPIHVRSIPYKENGIILGAVEIFSNRSSKQFQDAIYDVEKHLNYIDPLTEVFNRYFINDKLDKIIENKDKFAIMFIDIDNFKKVNDMYGHLNGDIVLKVVAETIKRNSDDGYVVRFGGEEFIVFKQVNDLDEAKKHAEKLRMLVERSVIRFEFKYHPTISVGLTMLNGFEVNEAIDRADSAMYQAKRNGKNQIYVYE